MAEVWEHVLAPSTVVARSVPAVLTAFDLANGAQQWTTELCEQCVGDRLGVGPDLAFLAVTAHSLEGEMSSVAAVDQTTGTLRWEDELCDGCQVRAVATTGSVVLVLTGERLTALNSATGTVQHRADTGKGGWPILMPARRSFADLEGLVGGRSDWSSDRLNRRRSPK